MSFGLTLKKLFAITLTFFLIITASFFLLRTLPGSPFDEGRFLSKEILIKMEKKYGLDQPVHKQYFAYMQNLISKGDLGPSLKYPNRNVNDILFTALPVSLTLGALAFVLSVLIGISSGVVSAVYPNTLLGKLAQHFSTFGISMPSFVFAAILISIFGLGLKLLPVALWEGPSYMVLPVLTLSIAPSAYISKITRSAMQANLNRGHIRTALAKGLDYNTVIMRHCLANSMHTILTVLGPIFAILITGSFVVEYIFAIPGMGKYFVTAFINRDYFLVSGVIIIFSVVLLLGSYLDIRHFGNRFKTGL